MSDNGVSLNAWSVKKSSELYGINSWGSNFFSINEKGHVIVTPTGDASEGNIDLRELVSDLQSRGLRPPLLIRFSDIVDARIKTIATAFQTAIESSQYRGQYRGVFPIKVNQQRFLVEEIVKYGAKYNIGLEAGSKPELLIALAVLEGTDSLLIANGFKDMEFIETALLAQKLGRKTIIVVDRFSEIEMIIQASKNLNIRPCLGFRAKLESKGAGKWVESSGAKSKFGLNSEEIVRGVERLKQEGMLSCLELLHFHIGSQITALRAIKDSLIEASRIYVELVGMGAGLKYLDVGGGLGVDYDGSQTNWENSVNYTIQEYANDVIGEIAAACNEKGIAHPNIVTESGRAMVAHHSVLIFDVVGSGEIRVADIPAEIQSETQETIAELFKLHKNLSPKTLNESIQDAFQLRDEGITRFNLGYLTLRQRAMLETLFRAFCTKALEVAEQVSRKPEEITVLRRYLSDNYYCNFSIFQSAPDTWAVQQLFPIMPIHRLAEKPTRRGILLDLTCDSDGKIDRFIDIKDVKDALELHSLRDSEDYYIGMFLIGAYQEILGDFHNLFGDTDAVHVSLTPMGYSIDHVVEGDTVTEVLSYVQYERPALIRQFRTAIEKALVNKTLSLEESRLLMRYYDDGLNGYTYLDQTLPDSDLTPLDALRKIGQRQAETNGNGVNAQNSSQLTEL